MVIRCRAPLRLGLAGGGTDVAPFCDIYGGCVLNATIDRYVYATLEANPAREVVFESCDLGKMERLPPETAYALDGGMRLHRAVYNYFIAHYNAGCPAALNVYTLAEAPAGSGLGTSSTLVVALCRAFAEYFQASLDDYELADLAFRIEREHCGLSGGKQDQYTAVFGGINFMEFMQSGRVLVNPLRIKKRILCEFESSLLLYFTGVSRDSANIIKAQARNVLKPGEDDALLAMQELKDEAYDMKAALLTGDFDGLFSSFRKGWESKKRTSRHISNSSIDKTYMAVMQHGAKAAKISGAGGGGFMMCLVPPARRVGVMKVLESLGGEIFPAHFTKSGVEAWKI